MNYQNFFTKRIACAALLGLALAGCERNQPAPEPTPTETADPEAEPTQSIFSPEAGVESTTSLLQPLETSIGFPEGGSDLNAIAKAELATIVGSPQMKAGGPIVLRGHGDSEGTDAAGMRVSQRRAEAVRDWLVENGVPENRLTVIAFGEQNPVAPNALPDGSPNEKGRARNRRVDVAIAIPGKAAEVEVEEQPTLVEQLAESSEE